MAHAHSHVVVVHDKEQEHAATQHQQMVVYHALDQQLPPFHATKDHVQFMETGDPGQIVHVLYHVAWVR